MEKIGAEFKNHCSEELARLIRIRTSACVRPVCSLKLNISYHSLCFAFNLPCESCYSNGTKMSQMSNLLGFYCMECTLVSPTLTWSCLLLALVLPVLSWVTTREGFRVTVILCNSGTGPKVYKPQSLSELLAKDKGTMNQLQISVYGSKWWRW